MNNAPAPAPLNGGLLIGGPKPEELRLAAMNSKGEAWPITLGPGLQMQKDPSGVMILRAVKPLTATVVGQKAERQEDGSYIMPAPIPGAIPAQVSGHRVFSGGILMTPGKHYTISGENNVHRILPAAGYLSLFHDEVLADYVATY